MHELYFDSLGLVANKIPYNLPLLFLNMFEVCFFFKIEYIVLLPPPNFFIVFQGCICWISFCEIIHLKLCIFYFLCAF
jgi:hypothetical protein